MNTTKLKLTLGLMCGLLLLPASSQAATGAVQITENTAIFTIDFGMTGDETSELEVPIMAEYGVAYNDRVNTLGFSLAGTEGAQTGAQISALVLGDAEVSGTRYLVPKETEKVFTLFIIATFPEPIKANYKASITKLPFWYNGARTTVHQNQLDELGTAVLKSE